ncbi:hypothetical protein IAU59_000637 [Kwoniella sp. CBS 9459]
MSSNLEPKDDAATSSSWSSAVSTHSNTSRPPVSKLLAAAGEVSGSNTSSFSSRARSSEELGIDLDKPSRSEAAAHQRDSGLSTTTAAQRVESTSVTSATRPFGSTSDTLTASATDTAPGSSNAARITDTKARSPKSGSDWTDPQAETHAVVDDAACTTSEDEASLDPDGVIARSKRDAKAARRRLGV